MNKNAMDKLARIERAEHWQAIKWWVCIASLVFGLYLLNGFDMDKRVLTFMWGVMPWFVGPLVFAAYQMGKVTGSDEERERARRFADSIK